MRLLVFGRTGQVAREIARRAGPGVQVTALGREEADLADPEACGRIVAEAAASGSTDAVINAAAWTAVDRAEAEEAAAYAVNAAAPGAMARAAARAGARGGRGLPFLHVSTDYVFDGRPGRPWAEGDATGPLNAYGRTKLAGEAAVAAAFAEAGPGGAWAVLRTSWVFSAHGSNFVKTMLRLAGSRPELSVVDDQAGGPTPAAAIADALLAMARAFVSGRGESGIFHFAGAPPVTWCGFAREILAEAGSAVPVRAIPTSAFPTPARRPLNSVLDCARIGRIFGIPQPDWRAGLREVLAEVSRAG